MWLKIGGSMVAYTLAEKPDKGTEETGRQCNELIGRAQEAGGLF